MPEPKASDLDRRITFQAKGGEIAIRTLNTPMEGDWAAIATDPTVWAQVQDVMPSRGESVGRWDRHGAQAGADPAAVAGRHQTAPCGSSSTTGPGDADRRRARLRSSGGASGWS
jgi:hypothetical protein